MNVSELKNRRYLIIGGTSKAGTTSLYRYLANHPQICPSVIKETRFFLDADYPLPVKYRLDNSLRAYAEFFSHCDSTAKVLMEATPDYLYSANALHIGEMLPNAMIVFILRDPVERLISWFKFAKQCGMLDHKVSFEEYVEMQWAKPITPSTPVHLRALEQGRYERFLDPFKERMGKRMIVLSFERLKMSPVEVMKELCDFVGIDASFFNNYTFGVENESYAVRSQRIESAYRVLRRMMAYRLLGKERMMSFFRWVNRHVKRMLAYNVSPAERVEIHAEMRRRLLSYYAAEESLSKCEVKMDKCHGKEN